MTIAEVLDAPVWTDVGACADIPPRSARRIATREGDIAVFRTGDDRFFALYDRCPHKQGPLSQGIVHGHSVTCPLHYFVIDLATGEPTGADAGKGCAPTVPLEIRGERIFLAIRGG